jgi:intracellular sulfur oxidation DsrE/DsrF family protein
MLKNYLIFLLIISNVFCIASAEEVDFSKGPIFKNHGENTIIEGGLANPELQRFKVVFDIYKENTSLKPHRNLDSVARFINMHARAGVPLENIDVAIVVHGKASYDLMNEKAYKQKFIQENPSSKLLNELLKNKVKVFICGQSSAFLGLNKTQYKNGVSMSLSAMTANALLQQQGYTLNPF